jgi:hypothetical protein
LKQWRPTRQDEILVWAWHSLEIGRNWEEREERKDKGSKPRMDSPDHTQDAIGRKGQFASQSHRLVTPHQARVSFLSNRSAELGFGWTTEFF